MPSRPPSSQKNGFERTASNRQLYTNSQNQDGLETQNSSRPETPSHLRQQRSIMNLMDLQEDEMVDQKLLSMD